MSTQLLASATVDDPADSLAESLVEVLNLLVAAEPTTLRAEAVAVCTNHLDRSLRAGTRLRSVGCLRLAPDPNVSLPPLAGWPDTLRNQVEGPSTVCVGGHYFNGELAAALDVQAVQAFASELAEAAVDAVAISSVFSPVSSAVEWQAASILREQMPDVHTVLSHQVGTIGLIERENAAVLTGSLLSTGLMMAEQIRASVASVLPSSTLFLARDDGTVADHLIAQRLPLMGLSPRSVCSMIGAAQLSGESDCVVVEVGARQTSVGLIRQGEPRLVERDMTLLDVPTQLRRPDVRLIDVGSESTVGEVETVFNESNVGARSEALDAACADVSLLEAVEIASREARRSGGALSPDRARQALGMFGRLIDQALRTTDPAGSLAVVVVGSGAAALPATVPATSPQNAPLATAVGVASAVVAGIVDEIVSGEPGDFAVALATARRRAVEHAVLRGAAPESVAVVDTREVPWGYLPGNVRRVRVRAVGAMA